MCAPERALVIIDAYNLIFRSYFAFINNPLRNESGENTSAIFGFFRTVAAIVREYKPAELCIALDPPGPTFRHKLYADYKGTRERTPEDLKAQFPRIEAIMSAMNMPLVQIGEYEADDIIASLARMYAAKGRDCIVVSADKDLMQLVNEHICMMRPNMRGSGFALLDAAGVQESKGVRPDQIVDYLALLGDSSDNIPGVSGIGAQGACKLLAEYGSLAEIYREIDSMPESRRKKCLVAGKESADVSKQLIALVDTIELTLPEEGYPIAFTPHKAASLLQAENIKGVVAEYEQIMGKQSDGNLPFSSATDTDSAAKYAARYQLLTDIAEVEEWMMRIRAHKRCAFDTETTSLDPMRAEPVGLSFAIDEHHACYIPLRGPNGVVLAHDAVRNVVKPILEDEKIGIIGQNIKYDMKVMAMWGVRLQGIIHDTMIAAWLLDLTAHSYKLDVLAQKYLHYAAIPYPDIAKKEGFTAVDLQEACMYAAEDADMTYSLFLRFEKQLQQDETLYRLYREVELALLPILAEMEITGIKVDTAHLEVLAEQFRSAMQAMRDEIYRISGEEFNIQSTKALQRILFEKLALKPIKKTKTGFSTDTSVLTILSHEHPLPKKVLEYRFLAKMLSTYIEALPKLVHPNSGRIHTTFSIIGTNTGRMSSSDPNLQNIPIKDTEGRRIREAFVADSGYVLMSADYAQIELVVFAHLSQDPELLVAFQEGRDVHALTAVSIFGGDIASIQPAQRRIAKVINFGVMYGMSVFRLSRELAISAADAQRFIDQYFEKYAGVRRYIERTIAEARQKGYVSTLLGRKRFVPDVNSQNKIIRQAAERIVVNTPIQGSAADIIKLAMKNIHQTFTKQRLKSRMLLQVHDELVIETWQEEQQQVQEILEREMSSAYELSVPLRVHLSTSSTWGGLK